MALNGTRRISKTLVFMVIATGLIGMATIAVMRGGTRIRIDAKAVADGSASSALRNAFDGALPFKDAAISAMASVRYTIFGDGFPGVICGSDGWLFSSEEFEGDLGYLEGGFAEAVTRARDELASVGIALVVVIIPSKSRVYADMLGGARMPAANESRYGAALSRLRSLAVPTVDLLPAFAALKDRELLFLRSDSHWSQAGARLAATTVADFVKTLGLDLPSSTISVTSSGFTERDGDMMSFMPRRGTTPRPLPPPERLEILETTADSGAGLFGAQTIPVALVGTSYSAEPLWNFEGFVKNALSVDAINLAVPGKGPFAPMDDCLAGTTLVDSGVRLVLWEIPERYVAPSHLR